MSSSTLTVREAMQNSWPLRDETRSASVIQFPPTPPTMVPNIRGLVIVDTRSGLVFEPLVIAVNFLTILLFGKEGNTDLMINKSKKYSKLC